MRRPWRKPLDAPVRGRLFAGALAGSLLLLAAATPAGSASAVPYSDPNAVGTIGLCNTHGQQVTSGSVNTAPFAWRAVSTTPASAAYAGPSRSATLLAYQPIDGLAPSDWSGDSLTAASRYSNPSNPIAAATGADESLAGFMTEYSPKWDGFLQLRIYLDAANEPEYSLHYPALDIQVTGSTWHAVGGGQVNCNAGTAESIETMLLPASKLKSPPGSSPPTTTANGPKNGSTPNGSNPNGTATTTAPSKTVAGSGNNGTPAQSAAPTSTADSTTSSSHTLDWIVAAVIVAIAVIVMLVLARSRSRRRAGEPKTPPTEDKDADRVPVPSTKGSTQ